MFCTANIIFVGTLTFSTLCVSLSTDVSSLNKDRSVAVVYVLHVLLFTDIQKCVVNRTVTTVTLLLYQ